MEGEAHIVTVGTSVIRNSAPRVGGNLAEKLKGWARAKPGSPEDVEAGEKAAPGTPEFRAVYEILALDPRSVSAELNAMWPYLERRRVEAATLLATDSGASEFCAEVLRKYLRDKWGIGEVEVTRVPELGRDFEKGLYNLLDALSSAVRRHGGRGRRVYLNATGGFKPETAIVYVAASLMGIDRVYYIHEVMREVVELPILPLDLRPDYRSLARLLGKPVLRRELEERMRPEAVKEAVRRGILIE
ncbi:MAG: hypothetical protein DRJ67_10140, partial [Thermoprotei archaeon]